MKRIVWFVGLLAITAAAVALAKRCTVAGESERVVTGAPPEREEPQARAS